MHHHINLRLLVLCVTALTPPTALAMSSFPVLNPNSAHISPSHTLNSVSLPPTMTLQQKVPVGMAMFPEIARRQMEVLPPQLLQDKEPSCSELRSMWRQMRRMSRQMEFTNEIPKVPDPFVASTQRYGGRPTKYPDPNPYSAAKSSKDKVFHGGRGAQQSFGKIVRDPAKVGYVKNHVTSNRPLHLGFDEFDDYPKSGYESSSSSKGTERIPGSFADYSLPEESLGIYGTVVHSPEEKARYRAQSRRPQQFGLSKYRPLWTGREGDTSGIGRVPFMATGTRNKFNYGSLVTHGDRTGGKRLRSPPLASPMTSGSAEYPLEIGQISNGGARVERIDKIALAGKLKNSCLRLQNKACRRDIDCYCNGNPRLFCGGNRCRPVFKAPKYGNQKWGKSLYTYPYEMSSFAGYGPKRDPAWPEFF